MSMKISIILRTVHCRKNLKTHYWLEISSSTNLLLCIFFSGAPFSSKMERCDIRSFFWKNSIWIVQPKFANVSKHLIEKWTYQRDSRLLKKQFYRCEEGGREGNLKKIVFRFLYKKKYCFCENGSTLRSHRIHHKGPTELKFYMVGFQYCDFHF